MTRQSILPLVELVAALSTPPARAQDSVVAPRPGMWKVLIYAADVPANRSAAFTYTEIMTHLPFGTVDVPAAVPPRPTGARWTDQVTFHAAGAAPFGYELVAVTDAID